MTEVSVIFFFLQILYLDSVVAGVHHQDVSLWVGGDAGDIFELTDFVAGFSEASDGTAAQPVTWEAVNWGHHMRATDTVRFA